MAKRAARNKDIEVKAEETKQEESMSTQLITRPESGELSVEQVSLQLNKLKELMRTVLVKSDGESEGDYGIVPSCGPKPALRKSGAEKICLLFGLRGIIKPEEVEIENPTDHDYNVSGHRTYRVTVHMMNRYDIEQATGVGICSTLESKYRFRTVNTGHPVPLEYWRNRDSELLGGNTFEARKYS